MDRKSSWRNGIFAVAGVALVAVSWTGDATAQAPGDWDGLVNRINRLQEQIYDLRDANRGGGAIQLQGSQAAAPTGNANPAEEASLALRISNVEDQLRQLTGKIEQIAYQVQQLNDRFTRFSEDVEFRFQELGSGKRGDAGSLSAPVTTGSVPRRTASAPLDSGGVSGSLLGDDQQFGQAGGSLEAAAPPRVLGTIPAEALGSGSLVPEAVTTQPLDAVGGAPGPEQLYKETHEKLLRRQFAAAELGFKTFLRKYPDHKLAGNAQYWLGETFYARRQYKLAAEAFLKGYQDHSKGPKAADSLVKLGMTLDRLGQQKQACAALVEAERRYPSAREVRKIAARERSRVGCR